MMDRIPSAAELSRDEMISLRAVVARSFIPATHINPHQRARLLQLGLVQSGMGGLMPTPAGKIVSRF
jgi:hypothetical protein